MVDSSGEWRSHAYLAGDPLGTTGDWPEWVAPPYPPADLGPCPICGRATKRASTWKIRSETATSYVCTWCRADRIVFHTGRPGHTPVPSRPYYAPPDMRWDMCRDPVGEGETSRYHASGHWGSTLCGLAATDLVELNPQWWPDHPDACPECQAAAAEIDARWPADRRAGGDLIVACTCPACRSATFDRRP